MSSVESYTVESTPSYTRRELNSLVRLVDELRSVANGTHRTFLFTCAHDLPLWYDPSLLPAEIRNDANLEGRLESFLLSDKTRRCTLKACGTVSKGFLGIMVSS